MGKVAHHIEIRSIPSQDREPSPSPCSHQKTSYLLGLRGILAIQSFIWIFFSTFIPALVSNVTPGPKYQEILREVFSVPFWNASLISSFFILLSMRTICVRFLSHPTPNCCGGTFIRRIVRFVVLLSIASGLGTLILAQIGTQYIDVFKATLPNMTIETPVTAYSALAALNSIFDLFWLTTGFATQAANTFWPSATLWVPSVIYYQGWTVYILMIMLPFTRPTWHFSGLTLFALGSFWYASWGWYSATGLFLADVACNVDLNRRFKLGFRVRGDVRCPAWVLGALMTTIGVALKYAFVVVPQYADSLLVLHPFLDLSETTSRSVYIANGPYPRLDDWLMITGVLVLVECMPRLQTLLSAPGLVYLGERAFSIFTAQSIVFWTAGIKLWLLLHFRSSLNTAAINTVIFVVWTAIQNQDSRMVLTNAVRMTRLTAKSDRAGAHDDYALSHLESVNPICRARHLNVHLSGFLLLHDDSPFHYSIRFVNVAPSMTKKTCDYAAARFHDHDELPRANPAFAAYRWVEIHCGFVELSAARRFNQYDSAPVTGWNRTARVWRIIK
nr:hypothetical protein CFP56_66517 [Quercus suber]